MRGPPSNMYQQSPSMQVNRSNQGYSASSNQGYSTLPTLQTSRRSPGRCTSCVNLNVRCPHCFYCGGENHRMNECPVRNNSNNNPLVTVPAAAPANNGGTGLNC